jgi:mRNA-degrading endonuclease RelE of RelBE toxin-antitoxin system
LNEPFKSQIKEHLNELESYDLMAKDIKPLTGELKGYSRLRSGEYRIFFQLITMKLPLFQSYIEKMYIKRNNSKYQLFL